jgi:glutathione S-transferase
MLKIWGRRNSSNVQKVVWCCDELGLEYERVDAGGEFGVIHEAGYLARNPNALVPTIDDDGFVLWESNAIVRYLCAKHGTGGLFPNDLRVRADADRWMDWQASTLWPALRRVFFGLVRTPPSERNSDEIQAGAEATASAFGILDGWLSDRPYLAGEAFTMGDIPAGIVVYRWLRLEIPRPDLPRVAGWYERLCERPPYRDRVMLPLT